MWVKYFIPDDGDDQLHPNMYNLEVSSSNSVSLSQIRESFPMPGKYQFRYLKSITPNLQVWFDVSDGNALIPVQDGLLLKVSRVSTNQNNGSSSNGHIVNQQREFSPTAVPAKPPRHQETKVPPRSENIPKSDGLLNFDSTDEIDHSPPKSTVKSSASADLLGFDSSEPISTHQSSASSQHNSSIDLFGLDTLQPMQPMHTSVSQPMAAAKTMGSMPIQTSNPNGFGSMNARSIDPFSNLDNSGKSVGGYERRGSTGQQPQQPARGMPPQQGQRKY